MVFILRHLNKKVRRQIEKYGFPMSLVDKATGDTTYFTAQLQPLRYKNKMYLGEVVTALGYDNSKKYLLIAPDDVNLSDADGYDKSIVADESTYSCDRFEYVTRSGEKVYSWAIITISN